MTQFLKIVVDVFDWISSDRLHRVGLIDTTVYRAPQDAIGWHRDQMELSSKNDDDEQEVAVVSYSAGASMPF
eukprot:10281817-Lingulodinium_polyedra.AAC.1